jgi:hypothetical protein
MAFILFSLLNKVAPWPRIVHVVGEGDFGIGVTVRSFPSAAMASSPDDVMVERTC